MKRDPAGSTRPSESWRGVDEGWGRRAVDFSTLAEPTNCREYVALHHHLNVGAGDTLLDVACGAGLAIELASLRGARCAGIDASERLVAVARDRYTRRRPEGRRHARPAMGRRQFRRRDQLPGHLGDDPASGDRGAPCPGPRRPDRAHGVGAHQGLAGRVGAGAVLSRGNPEGREPSRHGGPRPARRRRGASFRTPASPTWSASTSPSCSSSPIQSSTHEPWRRPARLLRLWKQSVKWRSCRRQSELAREKVRAGLPLRAPVAVVGYVARKPARRAPIGDQDVGAPELTALCTGFLGSAETHA